MGEKPKVNKEYHLELSLAALASAYNGIIGSPLFTGVLATEFQIGGMAFISAATCGVAGRKFTSTLAMLQDLQSACRFSGSDKDPEM
jgi:hypothetical protein